MTEPDERHGPLEFRAVTAQLGVDFKPSARSTWSPCRMTPTPP